MKAIFAKVGMVVSALVIFMGILVIAGSLGGDTSHAASAPFSYDTGYASFGADFYSYVSNNAAEAASAARTTAANLNELTVLLKNICGIALMGMGAISLCAFGLALGNTNKAEEKASDAAGGVSLVASTEPAPAAEEATVAVAEEPAEADAPAAEEEPAAEEAPAVEAVAEEPAE